MTIEKKHELENEVTIRFIAEEIRKTSTGVHARISAALNTTLLAWTNGNVERDEDRVRFINSAYTKIGDVTKAVYPKEHFKHDYDLFCRSLWQLHVEGQAPIAEGGSEEPFSLNFALRPFILEGGGTAIFGPPGKGKSYTLQTMAVALDAGLQFPWESEARRVLFINLERSRKSVRWRLGNINAALGLPRNRPLLVLHARGRSLFDILDVARDSIAKNGVDVVFLDSISRAGMGDLTENNPANKIVDAMNGLCETWVGIGHSPRADDKHIFGSVFFDAGADIMVQLQSERRNHELGVSLRVTKGNDISDVAPRFVVFQFGENGLSAIRTPASGEFAALQAEQGPRGKEEELRDYLLEAGNSTATDIANALGGQRNTWSAIANHMSDITSSKRGRDVYFGVKTDQEYVKA
jgi:hypothetical protein